MPQNLKSVRMMLSGFIGLAVVYAGTAVYTFQLRAVDETPEIKAAKAKILAERDERRKVRILACYLLGHRCLFRRATAAALPPRLTDADPSWPVHCLLTATILDCWTIVCVIVAGALDQSSCKWIQLSQCLV